MAYLQFDASCWSLACATLLVCACSLQGCGRDRDKHNILIVVDMQKDYDIGSNIELYGYKKSEYSSDLAAVVPAINKVRQSRAWDMVIFTKDWLDPDVFDFCQKGSKGTDLLDGLWFNEFEDFVFTKSVDDVFNTVNESWGFGYGLRKEGEMIGLETNKFQDILLKLGFAPHNTVMTLVGHMTDRCVLKSALHAHDFGYEVILEKGATETSQKEPVEWNVSLPPLAFEPSSVFKSRGGPGEQKALDYMSAVGIKMVPYEIRHAANPMSIVPKSPAVAQATWDLRNASAEGHLSRVKELLERMGADVEAVDSYKAVDDASPIIIAAYEGHLDVVAYLWRTALADAEATTRRGFTPLMEASFFGHLAVVKFLCENASVKVDQINSWDQSTALISAASAGHLDVFRYLHKTNSADLEHCNCDGFTPLLQATWKNQTGIMNYCVANEADTYANTEQGLTMFDFAMRGGNTTIIDIAKTNAPDVWYILRRTAFKPATWCTLFLALVTAIVSVIIDIRLGKPRSSKRIRLTGARVLAARTITMEESKCGMNGHHVYRALELIANWVYPCGICMMLVTPPLGILALAAFYFLPAWYVHKTEIFSNPAFVATVRGQPQRLFALVRLIILYPMARAVCMGYAHPSEWFTVNDVVCGGSMANQKARWFINPDWDVWKNRQTTLPFTGLQISSDTLFKDMFIKGILLSTLLWAFLVLYQILRYVMKGEAQEYKRIANVDKLAHEIEEAGTYDRVAEVEFRGQHVQPLSGVTRWPPSQGLYFKLVTVFFDIFGFDFFQTVILLTTGDYMFAFVLAAVSWSSSVHQLRILEYRPQTLRDEVRESLRAGVMTDKLMQFFARENGMERFLILGLFCYAFPFVGRATCGLVNSIFAIVTSVFVISDFTTEHLDLCPHVNDEEMEDESDILTSSESESES